MQSLLQILPLKPRKFQSYRIGGPFMEQAAPDNLKIRSLLSYWSFIRLRKGTLRFSIPFNLKITQLHDTESLLLLNLTVKAFCKNLFCYYINVFRTAKSSASFKNLARYSTSRQHQVFPF